MNYLELYGCDNPEQTDSGIKAEDVSSGNGQEMYFPNSGEKIIVYGKPYEIGERLDDHQGDNELGFRGNCGLVSVNNILRMANIESTEDSVLNKAIKEGLCEYASFWPSEKNGGASINHIKALLEKYGVDSEIHYSYTNQGSLESIAQKVEAGHGVIQLVNSGLLYNRPDLVGSGLMNHAISVTGTARDVQTGELKGFFICDSGITNENSKALYCPVEVIEQAYTRALWTGICVTSKPIR